MTFSLSYHNKREHVAAVYDACNLIVNTYMGTDLLDGVNYNDVSAYDFMKFARQVLNQISEGEI